MQFLLLAIIFILFMILAYVVFSSHNFRKMVKTHVARVSTFDFIGENPENAGGDIHGELSHIERQLNECKEKLDEHGMLKENSESLLRELTETRDHLMNKISELHALFEISTSISILSDSANLYESIPDAIKRFLGIEEVALFVFDENRDGLIPVACSDSLNTTFKDQVLNPNDGVVGRVYRTGESVYVPDLSRTSEILPLKRQPGDIRSLIVVPIKRRERTIGVFYVSHKEENAFDPETFGTLKTLVRNISVAIENTELYQYARKLAERDSLTLLYNHGTFHSRLSYELDRGGRYSRPMSVIMLDIDAFKIVNDNFGHATGDRILKMVAGVINAHTRKTDISARYGGDEFAIILPETDLDAAHSIAKRICTGMKGLRVDTGRGGEISVTASFGIASCDHDSPSRNRIVEIADTLMYSAKKEGIGEIVFKRI